jgi:hypothetical protein
VEQRRDVPRLTTVPGQAICVSVAVDRVGAGETLGGHEDPECASWSRVDRYPGTQLRSGEKPGDARRRLWTRGGLPMEADVDKRIHSLGAMARALGRGSPWTGCSRSPQRRRATRSMLRPVSVSRLEPGTGNLRTLLNVGDLGPQEVRWPEQELYSFARTPTPVWWSGSCARGRRSSMMPPARRSSASCSALSASTHHWAHRSSWTDSCGESSTPPASPSDALQ